MMKLKKIAVLFISVWLSLNLYAQTIDSLPTSTDMASSEFSGNVQIALSNADYMVTAGDVYSLSFIAKTSPVSYTIAVDPTYKIRVANLAVLDVSGKSYIELKKEVEEIVQKNFPMSGVQFVLLNPGNFKVYVYGEVDQAQEKNAWALTRLSSIVSGTKTSYTSIRDIQVISSDGKKNTYDLFKAFRDGDLSQNPYVRPGDKITLSKYNRVVTITGDVKRSGSYELLAGENLKSLIQYYGDGLTDYADTSRITLVRRQGGGSKGGETLYLTQADLDNDFVLHNGDIITIASFSELQPSIIVEGIINNPDVPSSIDASGNTAVDSSYRISATFYEGENYASFVRRINGVFSNYSDLQNSYIERSGLKIPLNIEKCLFDKEFVSEYKPAIDDKLVIPFRQNFQKVLIKGEVKSVVEENAWPLRRLSQIIQDNMTEYSSTRNVIVTSVDGKNQTYDLFRASRYGEMDQDPYVYSGETITVQRLERKVTISGQVERPGTYELLEGENLGELIQIYGNGLKSQADMSRVSLTRTLEAKSITGEKKYLTPEESVSNYVLLCYDSVNIESYSNLKPVMFMKGAFSNTEEYSLEASNYVSIQYEPGTRYTDFIRSRKEWFRSTSDIQNAYIKRGNEIIPYDLTAVLYDANYYDNLEIQEHDTLLIPYKQNFVTVSGSVALPGRYPYIPDRTYEYYVGLAGGFIRNQNFRKSVTITDINGNEVDKSAFITPECNIVANANSFTFHFNQYAPVITTLLNLIMTIISIWTSIS